MRKEKPKPERERPKAKAKGSRSSTGAAEVTPRRSPRLLALAEDDSAALSRPSSDGTMQENNVAESEMYSSKTPPSSSSDSTGKASERRHGAASRNCRRSARLIAISGRNGDGRVKDPDEDDSAITVRRSRSSHHSTGVDDGRVGSKEHSIGESRSKKRGMSAAPRTKNGIEKKLRQTTDLRDGLSRKRSIDDDDPPVSLDWTYEQEMLLRRAYVLAKPSPHFWKKVSKMVPGKSAQECFDRMHSKLATPAQLPARAKSKLPANLSPLLCGDLFSEKTKKTKKMKGGRKKDHLGSKAVRHILRKHSAVDLSQEIDLFSVLEETSQNAVPEVPVILSENELTMDSPIALRGVEEKKKVLSRFCEPSPEVLRPIKNIMLHERYIDQLHCREAKRVHSEKRIHSGCFGGGKENRVNSAKSALISEAKEFIHQLDHKLADPHGNYDEEDEYGGHEEEA